MVCCRKEDEDRRCSSKLSSFNNKLLTQAERRRKTTLHNGEWTKTMGEPRVYSISMNQTKGTNQITGEQNDIIGQHRKTRSQGNRQTENTMNTRTK